jgi:hypothetical protein
MALDAYIEAHRADAVRAVFYLVEIRLPVVQRLTTCDQAIVYDGETFTPAPLEVDGLATDSSSEAAVSGSLSIGAGDGYWPTLLAALTEGSRHPEVAVYEGLSVSRKQHGSPQNQKEDEGVKEES